TVRTWDARTGAPKLTIKAHGYLAWSASFSSDGARILTTGCDGKAKIWDARTGAELLALKGDTLPNGEPRPVLGGAFSPDGTRVVIARGDRTAQGCDSKTGAELLTLKGRSAPLVCAAYSPDGSRIVTADSDGVKIWDAETGTEMLAFKGPVNSGFT